MNTRYAVAEILAAARGGEPARTEAECVAHALRAMAPLPEDELAMALDLAPEPWPPPLTEADRAAAAERSDLLAPEPMPPGRPPRRRRRAKAHARAGILKNPDSAVETAATVAKPALAG
jgi:hypothetical protein